MEFQVRGRSVFATTGGVPFDAGKPTIVFIHGASFDATVWKLCTRYFAWRDRSVLALDLPGHGRSEGPLLTSIEAMADWIVEALDALGVKEAALVGHSMGSLVAVDCALRHSERVRTLCLLGTSVPMAVGDVLLDPARDNEHLAKDLLTSWGYGRSAQYGGNRAPGMWMLQGGLRVLEHTDDDVLYTDLKACRDYAGNGEALAGIDCPALVVIGGKDMMTPPKMGAKAAAAIPGARSVVLDGVGHIMMDEAPDETLDALRGIL